MQDSILDNIEESRDADKEIGFLQFYLYVLKHVNAIEDQWDRDEEGYPILDEDEYNTYTIHEAMLDMLEKYKEENYPEKDTVNA